jgi:putative effector of murein hydrolase
VTTGIAEKIGTILALVAVFAVITGLVGALSGKYLFDAPRIPRDATGWAWVSHGLDAARAPQVNADAGLR